MEISLFNFFLFCRRPCRLFFNCPWFFAQVNIVVHFAIHVFVPQLYSPSYMLVLTLNHCRITEKERQNETSTFVCNC